jgi:hypothetical protein
MFGLAYAELAPPGRLIVASFPQPGSPTSETFTFFDFRSFRDGENQPTVAGIDTSKLEHMAKEGPIRFRVPGVDHNGSAVDHG